MIGETRLRLVPSLGPPRRHCAVCDLPLPAQARPAHQLCKNCWCWCGAGDSLRHATRALRETLPGAYADPRWHGI